MTSVVLIIHRHRKEKEAQVPPVGAEQPARRDPAPGGPGPHRPG